jgi:hypothetical protein
MRIVSIFSKIREDIRKSICTTGISILLRQFRIFSKNRGDIRGTRCTPGVVDTGYQRHRRQIRHRCQRQRWQNMETISCCRLLKVNLKAKIYIYVNSTTQRCSNKIIKNFLIEDFFHLHLEPRISPEFSKKFEIAVMVYSGAWGKPIHEKNQKSKISWHCPFK